MNPCATIVLATWLAGTATMAVAGDGALDPGFGTAGKLQLEPLADSSSTVADDVAVQPDGKTLVVGHEVAGDGSGQERWRITRLNADGSVKKPRAAAYARSLPDGMQMSALRLRGRVRARGNGIQILRPRCTRDALSKLLAERHPG